MTKDIRKKTLNKSTRKAIFFVFVVIVLVVLSLLFRVIFLIKSSNYNSKDRFTISVVVDDDKAMILSFNPENETISEITLNGKRKNLTPARLLGVFIDGTVILGNNNPENYDTATELLNHTLLNPQIKKTNLNHYDLFKLYLFSKLIKPGNYNKESIRLTDNEMSLDQISQKNLIDSRLLEEQKSIEIINGTSIEGLGRRLERVIKNSGGNVISVTNSREDVKTSKITMYDINSYTLSKLAKNLKYPTVITDQKGIADIIIIIGKDGIREEIF